MIAGAAVELALGLGLPESEIERIRVASLLHDLGKLAIPEEILTKPGELNDPEWRIVSEHPEDRPGHPRAGRRAARRGDDRAPSSRVVRRPRLSRTGWPARRSRSAPGSWRSPTPTRRWSPGDRTATRSPTRRRIRELRRHGGMQFDPHAGRGVRRSLRRADAVRDRRRAARPSAPARRAARRSAPTPRSTTRCTPDAAASSRPCAPLEAEMTGTNG